MSTSSGGNPDPATDQTVDALRQEIEELRRQLARHRAEIDTLRQLCSKDPLTGIANRRRFDEELMRRIASHERLGHSFALVLIDLNAFRSINERWGHVAGDRALRHVAQSLNAAIRATDLVARIGGDEFALLFPDTDEATAMSIVNRVARNMDWSIDADRTERLSWSAGGAVVEPGDTPESLLHRADRKLYDSKRNA